MLTCGCRSGRTPRCESAEGLGRLLCTTALKKSEAHVVVIVQESPCGASVVVIVQESPCGASEVVIVQESAGCAEG